MCVIHDKTILFKEQNDFEDGTREVPLNSFVREFFTERLLPFTGKTAPLRLLTNVLEVSWRIFISNHMHYANSATTTLVKKVVVTFRNASSFCFAFTEELQRWYNPPLSQRIEIFIARDSVRCTWGS